MRVLRVFDGCYEASRAAALSGVPVSTLYDWARKGVVTPSVSMSREKYWSYADLMTLRIVYWLRHPKGTGVKGSPMSQVREAMLALEQLGLDIWEQGETPLRVDQTGRVTVVLPDDSVFTSRGDPVFPVLDLLGPFDVGEAKGPNLVRPRPHLRIIPGRVSGEPHLEHSRITTRAIAALARNGYSIPKICRLYPDQDPVAVEEAVDLEEQLAAA